MHLSEILMHLGEARQAYFNAVSPPVIQSSNFAYDSLDAFRAAMADEQGHHLYTRGNNPTVEILRKKLAALEGTEDALVFSSGSAAIANAVLSTVQAGDHIVCVDSPYTWTKILLQQLLQRFGVTHTFVDGRSMAQIEAAIQPNTRLLYLESPNSLSFDLQDLKACAELARSRRILTCIDNSYASPIFQQPATLGIDLVIHSATKYLNGHSDVVAGVVCGSKALLSKLFIGEYMTLGAIISPHDAALMIRGLRTLDVRMQRIDQSTRKIVAYLKAHPLVEQVVYPLDPDFPQYDLARAQMQGAGGLFSAYLKAARIEQMEDFFQRIQRFLLAVSWGGHESLILPAVAFYKVPGKADSQIPWNYIRFYIGLEDPDWLIQDLEQAFEAL